MDVGVGNWIHDQLEDRGKRGCGCCGYGCGCEVVGRSTATMSINRFTRSSCNRTCLRKDANSRVHCGVYHVWNQRWI